MDATTQAVIKRLLQLCPTTKMRQAAIQALAEGFTPEDIIDLIEKLRSAR